VTSRVAASAARSTLVDVAISVLRSGDGRPMHLRHLVDTAIKRRLVDTRMPPQELVRWLRAAFLRELRDGESAGLRPRVRALGGGQFSAAEHKLDGDLVHAERAFSDGAKRLHEVTLAALRRQIGRLPPAAFEVLVRTLVEKLGVDKLELVRHGDGVVYWGGERRCGITVVKILLALRAGEGEIDRRAVGELRAGVVARGFGEGWLFAGGNAHAEALNELAAGSGVIVYDGAASAQLCLEHGAGVRRAWLPVAYLDVDFFADLGES
jgi:hypothetical protein